jgi:hypothetical protein
MTTLIVDIEANGLLDTVDTIWCIVAKVLDQDKWSLFTDQPVKDSFDEHGISSAYTFPLRVFRNYAKRADMVGTEFIMHNGIAYDAPVLRKVLDMKMDNHILDTLIMSRLLYPDRDGGHSLESWMKRMGGSNQKVQNEKWDKFDSNMIVRCKSDVLATEQVYKELLAETERNKLYV